LGWHPVAALPDIYTTRQYTTYIERKIWEVRVVPCLCLALYTGIRLTTEGKSRNKTSVRVAQYQNSGQAQYQNNEQTQYQNNEQTQYKNNEQTQYKNNEQTQYKNNEQTQYKNNEYAPYRNRSTIQENEQAQKQKQ
jgi:hypothetical protein